MLASPCLLAMFAGRATTTGTSMGSMAPGGKGGKLLMEELYGFSKKPKINKASSGRAEKDDGKKETKDKEESALACQILEAARRLMERRRLEIYLKECGVNMEQSNMPYR